MKEQALTPIVKSWLESYKDKKWKQDKKNPNRFSSNSLELIDVYEHHVRYFEDIRAEDGIVIDFKTLLFKHID